MSDSNNPSDKLLGMQEPISRRDFLNSTLLATGGMLLSSMSPAQLLQAQNDWTGFGGIGDYSASNGNTWDVIMAGHQIRDGLF